MMPSVWPKILLNARFRERNALPPVSRRFADVAPLAIQRMRRELENKQGKVVYKHYISALERYLVPFFGKHHVTHITQPLLREFDVCAPRPCTAPPRHPP